MRSAHSAGIRSHLVREGNEIRGRVRFVGDPECTAESMTPLLGRRLLLMVPAQVFTEETLGNGAPAERNDP